MVTVFGLATTRNVFHIGEEALMYLCWETWILLVFLLMMFEICNCDLTRGRHVIGGGTGELPPKEMNISVLGCVACWWASSYTGGYCYLLLSWNIIGHTQHSSLALAYLAVSFLQGFGNVTAYHQLYLGKYRYMVCFLAGSWPDNKEWMSETRGDAKVIPTRTNKLSWEIEKVEESWGVNEVGAREHVCSLFFRDGDWSVRTNMGVQKDVQPWRSQEDDEVWQDLSTGKSVVDALLAPTSTTKLEERQGRCWFSSMSIYLQSKVGRDVGFPHIRPQQNPKKNDDAERGA